MVKYSTGLGGGRQARTKLENEWRKRYKKTWSCVTNLALCTSLPSRVSNLIQEVETLAERVGANSELSYHRYTVIIYVRNRKQRGGLQQMEKLEGSYHCKSSKSRNTLFSLNLGIIASNYTFERKAFALKTDM